MLDRLRRVFRFLIDDPRRIVLLILASYLTLGLTVLGFNRSPTQVLVTIVTGVSIELLLARVFKRPVGFPLSAIITSCGLSLLLNYGHEWYFPILPIFLAISSKYVFTFKGRHVYNPAMFGTAISLIISREWITASPAYQWNGIAAMSLLIVMPALMFFMPKINRTWLVGSFLLTYTAVTALRAQVMRHHLPFETLFLGTLSSPSFMLFTFFMITDPATSPNDKREQVKVGVSLAIVDLIFHIFQSYYTFFFSALTVATTRFLLNHIREARKEGSFAGYFKQRFVIERGFLKPAWALGLALMGFGVFRGVLSPVVHAAKAPFEFETLTPDRTGILTHTGNLYDRLDPRMQHVAKWVLSVGDAVSTADVDNDGKLDLFFTLPLKGDAERGSLYLNRGDFKFERFHIPQIEKQMAEVEKNGIASHGLFLDYDGDGDSDLLITKAFGAPILLRNEIVPSGRLAFTDVSKEAGLDGLYLNSIVATAFDFDRDGKLDLFFGAVLPENLPDYAKPTKLNFFKLPDAEYPGDQRMFHFMHQSWHMARNGGKNRLMVQDRPGHFKMLDSDATGLPETGWSLAVTTGDFNQDGFTDIYVANDFGPDDFYLNVAGKRFQRIEGKMFGSVGKDTYKGMNATTADFDRNGWQDIYVSNVHHDLQAEGSLMWMFGAPKAGSDLPSIDDRATQLGSLNEQRFGWGAAAGDFDNDGWIDLGQANGMVDDEIDRQFKKCPDYWYVNEKIARSPPSIHSYANQWGDLRGRCIHGKEKNRLYYNRGNGAKPQFVDIASQVGWTEETNSRGMIAADLDNDGRLDAVVTHQFRNPSLYRNREVSGAPKQHWLRVLLESRKADCNRQGVGSEIRVAGQLAEVRLSDGFSSQPDIGVHFGLGAQAGPVEIVVNWCGLEKEKYLVPEVDRTVTLVRGAVTSVRAER